MPINCLFQAHELCIEFFENFGTHVGTGTVHFGGVYIWRSIYSGTGDDIQKDKEYKKAVAAALGNLLKLHRAKDEVDTQQLDVEAVTELKNNITTSFVQVNNCTCISK